MSTKLTDDQIALLKPFIAELEQAQAVAARALAGAEAAKQRLHLMGLALVGENKAINLQTFEVSEAKKPALEVAP